MAKNNKQQRNTGRQSQGMSSVESDDEIESPRGTQKQAQGKGRSGSQLQGQNQNQNQGGSQDILSSIRPALDEARGYIEGSPVRAAAIGAVAGGLLMTLFSTEKGRSFVKMAYDYANPMVAKYAREFITQQAGDSIESALSQH